MIVNVVFYEDPEPEDRDILEVFKHKADAKQWLEDNGWEFDTDYCVWHKPYYSRGFIEVFEKELQ